MIAVLATRFGQTVALLIVGGIAWTAWLLQHDSKIEEKIAVRVEKQAEKKDEKAQAARRRVDRSTDAGLLLAPWFRD